MLLRGRLAAVGPLRPAAIVRLGWAVVNGALSRPPTPATSPFHLSPHRRTLEVRPLARLRPGAAP
jgi:hypothetical protein